MISRKIPVANIGRVFFVIVIVWLVLAAVPLSEWFLPGAVILGVVIAGWFPAI
jgi:hypothetical protein